MYKTIQSGGVLGKLLEQFLKTGLPSTKNYNPNIS